MLCVTIGKDDMNQSASLFLYLIGTRRKKGKEENRKEGRGKAPENYPEDMCVWGDVEKDAKQRHTDYE